MGGPIMKEKNGNNPFSSQDIEKWFDAFFLDPLTSYLDETVFRIDLYDSESAFIIEALLPQTLKENIDIIADGQDLIIKVKDFSNNDPHKSQVKIRTITFPMSISNLKMDVSYENHILEIKLYKPDSTN